MSPAQPAIWGLDPFWLSLAVLLIAYGALVWDRLNRAIVALLGGGAMLAAGILDQDSAVAAQDFNTLALLIGMMLLVAIARPSGMFQYLAFWSAKTAGGRPATLLALLSLVTAMVSAALDNVTTVLLIAPVTLVITSELRLAAFPFLFSEVMASNIGGAATLIGDPPNILIGSAAGLSFNAFILHLSPAAAIVLAVQLVVGHLVWGRHMRFESEAQARVLSFRLGDAITDRPLLWKSLAVLSLVLAGFAGGERFGFKPGATAILGAALLLMLDNIRRSPAEQSRRVHATFGEIEWVTIFFFVGLFVIVAGVNRAGVLEWVAAGIVKATGGSLTAAALLVLWASALLSALVDNIPFVATMIPVIKGMAPGLGGADAMQPVWWALALGACLGGNGTLIGASANLTVAGVAERNGIAFGFLSFLKFGFPMMLGSIVLCMIYVLLRYLL
ncbi:MAG TPA: ArsB/NhaD family transporter [Dongiaceae bacterium]|nr:ArsB/NhaD family transporter [Dongiaceae bacterium]